MSFIVTIVHVFVSLFLMLTVLLQAGKGGGMGATFGGGSSQGSVFGGSGAGNFLSKLTTMSAALFMITSMTLAFLASTSGNDSLQSFSAQQRGVAATQKNLVEESKKAYDQTQLDAGVGEAPSMDNPSVDTPSVDTPSVDTPSVDTPSLNNPVDGESAESDADEPSADTVEADTDAIKPAAEPVVAPKPAAEQ